MCLLLPDLFFQPLPPASAVDSPWTKDGLEVQANRELVPGSVGKDKEL